MAALCFDPHNKIDSLQKIPWFQLLIYIATFRLPKHIEVLIQLVQSVLSDIAILILRQKKIQGQVYIDLSLR